MKARRHLAETEGREEETPEGKRRATEGKKIPVHQESVAVATGKEATLPVTLEQIAEAARREAKKRNYPQLRSPDDPMIPIYKATPMDRDYIGQRSSDLFYTDFFCASDKHETWHTSKVAKEYAESIVPGKQAA